MDLWWSVPQGEAPHEEVSTQGEGKGGAPQGEYHMGESGAPHEEVSTSEGGVGMELMKRSVPQGRVRV